MNVKSCIKVMRNWKNDLIVISDKMDKKSKELDNKVKENHALAEENKKLETELVEMRDSYEICIQDFTDTSSLVAEIQKELTRKEKALNKTNIKRENLERKVEHLESKKENLLLEVECSESKLTDLEEELAGNSLKMTNTNEPNSSSTCSHFA
jgi:chromosome segregation ATPase